VLLDRIQPLPEPLEPGILFGWRALLGVDRWSRGRAADGNRGSGKANDQDHEERLRSDPHAPSSHEESKETRSCVLDVRLTVAPRMR
jgi:hypothetical protein